MHFQPSYEYHATLTRVVDGDTVVLKIDLGFRVEIEQTLRLRGIDAPELIGKSREAGIAAKEALNAMLTTEAVGDLLVRSHKPLKRDKYGRYVADILYVNSSGETLNANEQLVARGFAQASVT